MNEEIDLRRYVLALFRHWKWIVGAAVVAAMVAAGIRSMLPVTYQAEAAVAIVETREVVQFDPRFQTVDQAQPYLVYPELATSDELLQQVLAEVGSSLPEVETVQGLRGLLDARPGNDARLVYLTVRHGDPETAAEIVNVWAELFVSWAGSVYGPADGDQLTFFQNQLAETKAELEAAEEALVVFQARNNSSTLGNRLAALRDTQIQYLAQQRSLRFLLRDIRDLRNQLAEEAGAGEVSFADQLAALTLQLKAFDAEVQSSLQFQTSADVELTGRSRQEQIRFLDGLIAMLETRMSEIDGTLDELEPRILELQGQKEAIDVEGARLQRRREVATETHQALARKVAEERIVAESTDHGVRLASRAAVPVRPAGLGWLTAAVVSGMLGFMASVTIVLAMIWWNGEAAVPAAGAAGQEEVVEQSPERGPASQSGQPAFERAESPS